MCQEVAYHEWIKVLQPRIPLLKGVLLLAHLSLHCWDSLWWFLCQGASNLNVHENHMGILLKHSITGS